MTTIDRLISSSAAAAAVPTPWAKAGLPAGAPLPIGALSAWETDLRLWVRSGNTEQEADSIWIKIDKLEAGFADQLTALEQAQQDLADFTADVLTLQREAFDENGQLKGGDAVPAEIRALLRRIAFASYVKPRTGSDTPGTGAPAAGPATPNTPAPPAPEPTDEERRGRFRTAAAIGGWALPEQARDALTYVRQIGWWDLTAAEVERWEGLPVGSLGA